MAEVREKRELKTRCSLGAAITGSVRWSDFICKERGDPMVSVLGDGCSVADKGEASSVE